MKQIFFLFFLTLASIDLLAQVEANNYYIVYVDNSRVTNDDGLNDLIFDKLITQFDSIKAHKKDKFLFFVSDGKSFSMTENPGSIDKLVDQVMVKNAQRLPDQNFDAQKLREALIEKLNNFAGKVTFSAYISENMAFRLFDSYSPLFGLFPKEIASIIQNKTVTVAVVFPKLTDRVKTKDVKEKCLNFYDQKEFENNVNYMVQSY